MKGILLEGDQYVVNHEPERELSERCGLTIRNRSRFGCTIEKAMIAIRRDSAQTAGDEVAVLELGGNDCDYLWAEISAAPEARHDCRTVPERFCALYKEAVAMLRRSGRRVVLMSLPPIHSERYLRFLCRNGLVRENILHWLGDVEAISRWQAYYDALVRQIAAEEGVELIDLRAAFPQKPEALAPLLCEDGIHPNRRGQDLICRTLQGCLAAAAV